MNAEKFHANGGAPEFTDEQKEFFAGMSPEEFEKLKANFQRDIAKATAEALELERKSKDGWSAKRREADIDNLSEDEFQHLLDKVAFAKTPSERAHAEARIRKYQEARRALDAKAKAEALENAAETSEAAGAEGAAEVGATEIAGATAGPEASRFTENDLKYYASDEGQKKLESMVIDAENIKPTSEAEEKEIAEIFALRDAVAEYKENHPEVVETAEPEKPNTQDVIEAEDEEAEKDKSLEQGMNKLNEVLSDEEFENVLAGRDFDDYGDETAGNETAPVDGVKNEIVPVDGVKNEIVPVYDTKNEIVPVYDTKNEIVPVDNANKVDAKFSEDELKYYASKNGQDDLRNQISIPKRKLANYARMENTEPADYYESKILPRKKEAEVELAELLALQDAVEEYKKEHPEVAEVEAAKNTDEAYNAYMAEIAARKLGEECVERNQEYCEEMLEDMPKSRAAKVRKMVGRVFTVGGLVLAAIMKIGSITSGGDISAKAAIAQSKSGVTSESPTTVETTTGASVVLEQDEREDNEAEKVSSTSKFTIDGKECVYKNIKHEGGYDKGMDGFYDDDKHNKDASMMGPAYNGKWDGSIEQKFVSYRGLMAGLKGSPEIASHIAMGADMPGATKNLHAQNTLNDFIDDLRAGSPEDFDKFMTETSDYINNYANNGRIEVTTIKAGTKYFSSYTKEYPGGDLGVRIDDNGVQHEYDVHIIDIFNADNKSLFNNDGAKERIRELFGLSKKVDFTAGWSAECGQLVVTVIEDEPDAIVEEFHPPELITEELKTPEVEISAPPTETPTPTPTSTPTPTPEVTPTPTPEVTSTPETVVTIPAIPSNPDSTPEKVVFTSTPTATPETTPPPAETKTPKGPNTNAGENHEEEGTTENNNNDTEVPAGERGNVNPEIAPDAAVPGENPDVNSESGPQGGLTQPEAPTLPPNQADANSRPENANMENSTEQEAADRMQAAEAERRNQ